MADELDAALAGAATGAVASSTEWAALKTAASEGRLRMEPGAAESCALACQRAHEELNDHIASVRKADRVDGLAAWPSGRQLADKFLQKIDGPPTSAVQVLLAHQDVLLQMVETYREAGAAYSGSDERNAAAFGGPA